MYALSQLDLDLAFTASQGWYDQKSPTKIDKSCFSQTPLPTPNSLKFNLYLFNSDEIISFYGNYCIKANNIIWNQRLYISNKYIYICCWSIFFLIIPSETECKHYSYIYYKEVFLEINKEYPIIWNNERQE